MLAALPALAVAVTLAAAQPADATFPGRNGGITFEQRTATGDSDPQLVEHRRLAAARPGARPRTLIDCELTDGSPSGGDCTATSYGTPSYSPDGNRIVFDAGARIGVFDLSAPGPPRLLSAVSSDDGDPAFAPDGRRIVFSGANDRGTTDLYVRNVEGGGARLIINDAGEPAWSSRNTLAYVRSGNVYVARPDGSGRRFVSSGVSPDWSPRASRLVVVRPSPQLVFDGPTGRIYTVLPSGRDLRRVGRTTNASHPVWSPDARSIAFDGFDLGVYARRVEGSRPAVEVAPTQVSGESGSIVSTNPAWRPLRP